MLLRTLWLWPVRASCVTVASGRGKGGSHLKAATDSSCTHDQVDPQDGATAAAAGGSASGDFFELPGNAKAKLLRSNLSESNGKAADAWVVKVCCCCGWV
jgi:hypothetical protein